MPVYARTDKASCEYLKNKKHFSAFFVTKLSLLLEKW